MPRCLSKKAFTPLENYSSIKGKSLTGFTLIELIIVLSLLAILASVAVAKFTDISKKAIVTQEIATISNLRTAVLLFRAANGYCPAEIGKDPEPERDILTLLENPPPYEFTPPPDPADGRNWHITENGVGWFGPTPDKGYWIYCPHGCCSPPGTWEAGTGKRWFYFRENNAGRVCEIVVHRQAH